MIGAITAGFLGGAGAAVVGDYESIATVTLASGQTTISFTSIPSTYSHLQIRGSWRTSATADAQISFNSDTTLANYNRHYLQGSGSAASATYVADRSFGGYYETATSTTTAFVMDILDYSNVNKYKVVRNLWGFDNNGSGFVTLLSGLWKNTAAISQIDLSATTFQQYSSFALYGVK